MSAGKVAENGFQYDISDTSGAKVIIYTLYINPDWDKNLMRELNDMMEKALVSGGLADWFKSSLSAEAYQITKQEYEEALAECKANINKRKHRVNRPHTTF